MAEEYFSRYRGIKTKLLSSRVTLGEAGTASAEVDVSLYSGVGAALRKAVGFSGENYRVSLRAAQGGPLAGERGALGIHPRVRPVPRIPQGPAGAFPRPVK